MADTPVQQPVDETTSTTTTTTTTKKVVETEIVIGDEPLLHIRDFLNLTKVLRDEFNIFEKKYRLSPPQTVEAWTKTTGLLVKAKV